MTAALSDLRDAFHRDGYLFPNDALTRAESAEALASFRAYDEEASRAGGVRAAFRLFPKIHLAASWADELIRHPAILRTVTRLLGPDLLVWSTNVFVREARSGDRLAWHQDALHYDLDGFQERAVRVWLALTDTTLANGTMQFAAGTHREGLVDHRTDADPDLIRSAGLEVGIDIDESWAVPVLLRAGQFSVHHMAVAHASGPNVTDAARVNFAIDYLAPSVAPLRGADTAMLVAGQDRHGNFELEQRLPAGSDAAMAQWKRSVAVRMRRFATP